MVRFEDMRGRLLGTAQMRPGDDPAAMARRLLRGEHGRPGSFYDPIPYRVH
jgi:hypothetical protein